MTERWLPVVGFEGLYEVSDLGRVRSLDAVQSYTSKGRVKYRRRVGRVLRPGVMKSGHMVVVLGRAAGSRLVHRLVLEAFAGPATEVAAWCRHLDDNPANNRLSNLRWGTPNENLEDSYRNGKRSRCPSSGRFGPPVVTI